MFYCESLALTVTMFLCLIVLERCLVNNPKRLKYWDMFLAAVNILLLNINAERTGSWSNHLISVAEMLPYFFATNKVNYSRWMSVYILDMMKLPVEVQSAFFRGEFAIRQTNGPFKGIWSDMATEKTVIRDSKGRSGIVGITQKKSALIRWSLTRHVLGHLSTEMRNRSGEDSCQSSSHEETKSAALKRDEGHVCDLITYIKDNMTNPFNIANHPPTLLNISTGMHASEDIAKSLLSSIETGSTMANKFVEGSFSNESSKSFYSPITKSGIKTFEDMTKTTNLKCKSGDIVKVHINPETIFRRALVLANCREDVTVDKVLSYPIGPIPTSLFHDDGTMRKANKANLSHQLENETSKVCSALPPFESDLTAVIRDGMALFQAMNAKQYKTFGDLLAAFIQIRLKVLENAFMVVDVFDRYDMKNSIKGAERERRSKSIAKSRTFEIIEGRSIPEWKKFLSSNVNKQSLIRFTGAYTLNFHETSEHQPLVDGKSVVLAGAFADPESVKHIDNKGVTDCADLASSQEEADTRIVLHAYT